MAGSTNFLQFNPGAANQESDAAYLADSQRTSGTINGQIFNDQLANKAFYQWSTLVAALAQSLANKGYTISDTNYGSLVSQLANIVTFADLRLGIQTVAFSTTPTFNALGTNGFDFTMGGNVSASTLTNPQVGQIITFVIKQGATTFTFSPPSNINGWIPIDPTANAVTVQSFIVKSDGTIWPLATEINLILAQLTTIASEISTINATLAGLALVVTPSDVHASRAFNTSYQNNTGFPLFVIGWATTSGSSVGNIAVNIGAGSPSTQIYSNEATATQAGGAAGFSFMVPASWFYSVNVSGAVGGSPTGWNEMTLSI